LIPQDALYQENADNYVLISQNNAKAPLRKRVIPGISDGKNVEVISGITENDKIILKTKRYSLPKSATEKNPFMPSRRR
jgi:hypothetical protein